MSEVSKVRYVPRVDIADTSQLAIKY